MPQSFNVPDDLASNGLEFIPDGLVAAIGPDATVRFMNSRAERITGLAAVDVIGRDIRTLAAVAGIPILAAEIEQRVAFAESLTMGKTIFEWPSGGAAARNIPPRSLATWKLTRVANRQNQPMTRGLKPSRVRPSTTSRGCTPGPPPRRGTRKART